MIILYDDHLDKPDSNFLIFIVSNVDFQVESIAGHQLVIVASGLDKSSVMRGVARAKALIQLEGDVKLTRVDSTVTGFGGHHITLSG